MSKALVHLSTTTLRGIDYWQAKWTDANGRRRTKGLGRCSNKSRAEATKECRIIEDTIATVSDDTTLGAFRDMFIAGLKVSDGVRANYSRVLDLFVSREGAGTMLTKIDRNRAAKFVDWLYTRTTRRVVDGEAVDVPVDNNTVHKQVQFIKAMFTEAVRRDMSHLNPFDRVEVEQDKTDEFVRELQPGEIEKIIEAAPDWPLKTMLGLAYYAGLRAKEAKGLGWDSIDFEKAVLHVHPTSRTRKRQKRTTKTRERSVPVIPPLMALLRAAYDASSVGSSGPCEGVGHNPYARAAKARINAGVDYYGDPFKALRKNRVTIWQKEFPAMTAAKWLGHSVKTAFENYYFVTDADHEKATRSTPVLRSSHVSESQAGQVS